MYTGRMSDNCGDNPDANSELLKEIRDILLEQNKLVDAQWAEYRERWDAQVRDNRRSMIGCFLGVATVIVIILLFALFGR